MSRSQGKSPIVSSPRIIFMSGNGANYAVLRELVDKSLSDKRWVIFIVAHRLWHGLFAFADGAGQY